MNTALMHIRDLPAAARSWARDWGGLLTIAMAGFFVYYVSWIFLLHPSEVHKTLVTDIAQPIVSLVMTILAWRASRQLALDIRERRAWKILTVAFLTYFTGNVMWGYYELVAGASLAVSWADLPYLMYYPICLAGLLMFPLGRAGRSRLTFALDAGIVMLCAAIVIWYLVLRPVALAQHVSSFEAVITLAYPVGNTVLLFGVIAVLLRRPSWKVNGALTILTLAIFFDAIADFGYSYQTLESSYLDGRWPDCSYMLGFTLMAVSAQYQYRMARSAKTEPSTVRLEKSPFSWLPYAGVGVAYGLLLFVVFQHQHGMEPIVWLTVGAFLITALVVARQIVALRENSKLLAEKSARESEARFVSLVQNSSDVITVIGRDGRVNYVSPCLEHVFGYQPQDLIGRQLRDFLDPDDRQRVQEELVVIAQASGKPRLIELRARHRNGNWVHVEAVLTNLFDEPRIAGIVINARDVTERKKAEQALRDGEERVRQAQKMEAVGQLAGGVAHDFNNQLAVMIGYAEMLLRGLSPEGNEHVIQQLGEIKRAGDRAVSLTGQLLAFSRILAEDETAIKQMAQDNLESNGHNVQDAGNGNKADRISQSHHHGVVSLT